LSRAVGQVWERIFAYDPGAVDQALTALERLGLFSVRPAAPLLLKREDAARAMAMSLDSFERHVEPHLKRVHVGRMRLIPVAELKRFVTDEAV
jgi:hypothetical protein